MSAGRKIKASVLLLLSTGLLPTPSRGESDTVDHQDNEQRRLRESIDHDSRIVGGSLASEGRYPSIVGLFDTDGLFKCGGTLILPDVVLCAAHCTDLVTEAEVGRFDLSKPLALEGAEKFQLIKKIDHPDYGANTFYNNDMDIALYKLGKGGTLKAKPIAINGDPSVPAPGDSITVAGWGATSEGGSGSYKLKKVNVNYMRNQNCQNTYSGYDGYITDDMFCANVMGGGKDACQGDSGGPAYLKSDKDTPESDILVGVVSWGIGCARAQYPGVYARPAYPRILDWIETTACELSDYSPCQLKVQRPLPVTDSPTKQPTPAPVTNQPTKPPAPLPVTINATAVKKQPIQHTEASASNSSEVQVASVSKTDAGGCYLSGTELHDLEQANCDSQGGSWLEDFPNCFLTEYRVSTSVSWCKEEVAHCTACGGVFFETDLATSNPERRHFKGLR